MEQIKNSLKPFIARRYWFAIILPRAFRDAAPISKVWKKMREIVVSFIAAALFLGIWGRIIDPSYLYVNASWIVWFLAITFVGRLIVGFIRLPAELYYEQQKRIQGLESEIKELEPSLSKLTVMECHDHAGTKGPIGIDVMNNASNDVTDIEIELTYVIGHFTHVNAKSTPFIVPSRSNSRFKTWANVNGTTIKAGSHEVVNFAQVDGEKIAFMLESGFLTFENSQYFIPGAAYDVATTTFEVFFEIRGKINGRTSQRKYRANIVYESRKSHSGEAKTGAPQIDIFIDIQGVEPI